MTTAISRDAALALEFNEAVYLNNVSDDAREDKMRQLAAKTFHSFSDWDYGKKVHMRNIDQWLGQIKYAVFTSKVSNFEAKVIEEKPEEDEVTLDVLSDQVPNVPVTVTFRCHNIAKFHFVGAGDDRKIDYIHYYTEVKTT